MTRTKKASFFVVASFVVCCAIALLLELTATLVLAVRDGRFMSAKSRFEHVPNRYVAAATRDRTDCKYVDTLFPHPYLAFVHHANPPCGNPDINNVGLFGPDFPSTQIDDRFVILVTGGSVAAQFAEMASNGPRYLESILNEKYMSPNGRPFMVLNGGDGAWKYPQQAILFMMYSDVIDGVVTLDGFNEYLALSSRYRFEYPGNNFHLVNPVTTTDFLEIAPRWVVSELMRIARDNGLLSRSNTVFLFLNSLQKVAQEYEGISDRSRTTVRSIFSLDQDWDREQRIRWNTEQYRKYLRLVKAMADASSVRSAFFIQPVPAIGKKLTDEELAVVGDLGYAERYQYMTQRLLELREEGLAVFSLLNIFESVSDSLYADAIHLRRDSKNESKGYELMADAVADGIAGAWQLELRGGEARE